MWIKQFVHCLPLAVLGDYLLLDRDKHLSDLILKPDSLYFLFEVLFGFLFLTSRCAQDIPFHFTHLNQLIKLQCVDACHQRLESEVDNPEKSGQQDSCGYDQKCGALQLRPTWPSRLLGQLYERLFEVIDKLSHLYI